MKVGFFINAQHPLEESMAQKIRDSVELVAAAREAGFDLICAGQHYLSDPYQMSATIPLLARLAAEADGMDVAATVLLLPLHNPVEIAESTATMDAICGGRFILGIGLGYREEEYTAFGVKRGERVERTEESLELIKLLWTEREVEFHGKFYQVPRINPATRPIQNPHPPIWVAANNDSAVRRAGRWGYPWLINPHATMPVVARQLREYRESLRQAGHPFPQVLPMMRELYVAKDRETAYLESRPFLESKYAAYTSWGQDKAMPEHENFSAPYQDLAHNRFLLGSPEDVAKEMIRYRDDLGVNYLIFRMQWPGMGQQRAMRQIEVMGQDVLPILKSAG